MVSLNTAGNQRQIVWLNGQKYKIIGGVNTQQANEFSPQVTTGAQSYDQRENVSQFVMESWTGGLGIKRGKTAEIAGRFWYSEGVDTRFPNQLTLGPLVVTSNDVTTGRAMVSGDKAFFAHFPTNNTLFLAVSDKVFENTPSGTTWTERLDVGSAPAGELFVWRGSDGTERIYAGIGAGAGANSNYSANGTVWTGMGFVAHSFAEYDSNLVAGASTTIRASTDGTTFTTHLTNNRENRKVSLFLNAAGEPTLFFWSSAAMLYQYDFYARKAIPISTGVSGIGLFSGMGQAVWNQVLYVADLGGVTSIRPDLTLSSEGPDGDHGAPYGRHMGSMLATRPWLFGFRTQESGESTASAIMAYTGQGWHPLYAADATIRGLGMLPAGVGFGAARLYWVEGDNGTTATIKYFKLPLNLGNPVNNSDYDYAATGYLITPWYDLNFANLTKTLLRMTIDGEDLDATETVVVSYQLDNSGTDGGSWTALGTFDANGESHSFGSGAGIAAKTVRFKIALARDTNTQLTPKVRALILDYQVRTSFRAIKTFTVSIAETIKERGAPFPEPQDIIDELKTAFNTTTLVDYKHGNDTAIKVQVTSWPHVVYDEENSVRDGTVQVQCLEPIAS